MSDVLKHMFVETALENARIVILDNSGDRLEIFPQKNFLMFFKNQIICEFSCFY